MLILGFSSDIRALRRQFRQWPLSVEAAHAARYATRVRWARDDPRYESQPLEVVVSYNTEEVSVTAEVVARISMFGLQVRARCQDHPSQVADLVAAVYRYVAQLHVYGE